MTVARTAIVCDNHLLFRDGVVSCLEQIPGVSVIAEASSVSSAIAKLQLYEPDILVCDLSIPGGSGFDILDWIRGNGIDVHTIVLSMHTELQYVRKARHLGASAFLAKEDTETDLVHAIEQPKGSFYTSESIGRPNAVARSDLALSAVESVLKTVSPAEMRILVLLSDSLTSREIAARLHISPKTVEAHRFRLAEKLDARGPNKLLEWAIRNRDALRHERRQD